MRVVTRLTGLNPDTIRAWERRYGAISPERTGGNTRLFSAADVKRLALLRDVVALGHPVSRVAPLDTPSLEKLLKEGEHQAAVAPPREEPAPMLGLERLAEEFLDAIDRFDVRRARDHLARSAALLATRDFLLRVAVPVAAAIHLRWGGTSATASSPSGADEARAAAARMLLRQCLATFPELHPTERGALRVIAATPASAECELGVKIAALFAAMRGFDVTYLGAGVSGDAMLWAIERAAPAVVLLGIDPGLGAADIAAVDGVVQRISPRVQVWRGPEALSGVREASDGPNVRRLASFEALELGLLDMMQRG